MQPDTVAPAATHADREAPFTEIAAAPPDPPCRRRRRWGLPGSAFLDRPGGDEYANRWLAACGQGG